MSLMITVSVGGNSFFSLVIMAFSRRTNELKSEIDISDELIEKFKNFWSHFKDTPLKGKNSLLITFSLFCCNVWNVSVKINVKMFSDLIKSGRNAILRGICPQVVGLFTVKLAGMVCE